MLAVTANKIANIPEKRIRGWVRRYGKNPIIATILRPLTRLWLCLESIAPDCREQVLKEFLFNKNDFDKRIHSEVNFRRTLHDNWT